MIFLVRLQPNEVEALIKLKLNYNLYQASRNKNRRGKTYYANNDDIAALKIVAQMRNQTIKQVLNNTKG